jgi:hypothetical protein
MATAQYDRENTRRINLKLNNKTDADIIRQLESQANIQGYLKRLIWEDMKGAKTMENKLWYAVQRDPEDDWGTGSYDMDEAITMAKKQLADYPETLIAVIDNHTSNPVCVEEIRDFY